VLASAKWYAPNTMALGEARYDLAMYPQGWLTAELSVSYTNMGNGVYLPGAALFTRYKMFAITNAAQSSELHPRHRDEVQVLERIAYVVTDARVESPLPSYVPQIVDKTAVVDDKRIGRVVQLASSGRWWAIQELLQAQKETVQRRRPWVVIALLLISLFPCYALGRGIIGRHKQNKIR
jgi:hypothetical protein